MKAYYYKVMFEYLGINSGASSRAIIMPINMCAVLWQCTAQTPGLS